MKVLVVDDSSTQRKIIKRVISLIKPDLEIIEAENGAKAFDMTIAEKPELIFSDWNMPEMDGIDFLRKLRGEGVDTKFIFLTTNQTEKFINDGLSEGANHFLKKPFTLMSLKEDILSLNLF